MIRIPIVLYCDAAECTNYAPISAIVGTGGSPEWLPSDWAQVDNRHYCLAHIPALDEEEGEVP